MRQNSNSNFIYLPAKFGTSVLEKNLYNVLKSCFENYKNNGIIDDYLLMQQVGIFITNKKRKRKMLIRKKIMDYFIGIKMNGKQHYSFVELDSKKQHYENPERRKIDMLVDRFLKKRNVKILRVRTKTLLKASHTICRKAIEFLTDKNSQKRTI